MAVGNHHPIKARHVKFDFGETPLNGFRATRRARTSSIR